MDVPRQGEVDSLVVVVDLAAVSVEAVVVAAHEFLVRGRFSFNGKALE